MLTLLLAKIRHARILALFRLIQQFYIKTSYSMDLSTLLEFRYKYQNSPDLQLGCIFCNSFHQVPLHHQSMPIMASHVLHLLHQIRLRQGSGPRKLQIQILPVLFKQCLCLPSALAHQLHPDLPSLGSHMFPHLATTTSIF